MKHFDPIKWVLLAGIIFTYLKGYEMYAAAAGEISAGYALACAFLLVMLARRLAMLRYLHMRMKKIDRLSGRGFEKYLKVQFSHHGYRTKLTGRSHDYGADLIVKRRGEKIVVQAKRYERKVGIAAVQEAVGAIAYYGADRAMVVTNSGFTASALNLARQNGVELWGRKEIQKKFHIDD